MDIELDNCEVRVERQARFFWHSPDMLCLVSLDGYMLDVNLAWQNGLGYVAEEVSGQPLIRFIHPDDSARIATMTGIEPFNAAPLDLEFRFCCKDGSYRQLTWTVIADADHACLYATVRDAAEYTRTEEAIRESEERIRTILDNVVDGIITIDEQGVIESLNSAACQIFGYAANEVIGQNVKILMPEPYHSQHNGYIRNYLDGGQAKIIGIGREVKGLRKDGSVFPMELAVGEIKLGRRRLFTGIVRDITERKQAEQALLEEHNLIRTLIDNIPDYIFVKDKQSRFVVNNQAHIQILGATSAEDLSGKTDFDCFSQELAAQYYGDEQTIINTGRPLVNREEITRDSRGKAQWLLTTKVPLRNSLGEIRGIVGISRDITGRKEAEERQVHLLKELEIANQDLKDFAYIVSHDLKAPLRAIGSISSWLCTDYLDKLDTEGQELVELLVSRVKRMERLIEGVLQYSRVGREKEKIKRVDLTKVVPELVEFIAPPANIEIKIETELPSVWAEPTRIGQVFQNLLSNAVKFMDKPQGEISISCATAEDYWKFSIADNGPGIDQKYFGKIFQIFQTLTPRDELESSGIGLSMVKKIVEMYGGRIWLESTLGDGTTFYFTLPQQYAINPNGVAT
jgi:PAS domain S-box-containing protein